MGKHERYGDMTGRRFGMWTVLGMTVIKSQADGRTWSACVCRCDCGKERVVYAKSLRSGKSRSCGCVRHRKAEGYTYSDIAGVRAASSDDWMFGAKGAKGLFKTNTR